MLRHFRFVLALSLVVLVLNACNKVPDHRRFIPKDAAVVAGVDLKSLGKTIAWNMITGSKLFKEMEKRVPKNNGEGIISGIDKAGIDALNTFYVYLKTDKRFNGGIKVTALVPLSSSADWEAFVKKSFPKAEIKDNAGIKTASLGNDMYVGWNSNLLIVINSAQSFPADMQQPATSPVDMTGELVAAFNITGDNSITNDKNFTKLENSGHDLTLWINYEQIMSQYMNESATMGGVTLSPAIWKGTAFACGFDFKKGKITGDLDYYSSGELSDIYKEFGATNANKDMIDRLPAKDLDMMIALHLSPKALRSMLEKTEVLGLANAGLSSMDGMDVDKLLDAFTGDMAFTMNSLAVKSEASDFGQSQKTNVNMSYIMKLNKKENFDKMVTFATKMGALMPAGGGYIMPIGLHDTMFLLTDNKYVVASNKYDQAKGILEGKLADKLPAKISGELTGHPFAMYFDIQQAISKLELGSALSADDAAIYAESRKLLENLSINGGEYKDGAMHSHLEVNFVNKEESSILTLLDFGMKINDAQQHATNQPEDTTMAQPN